MGYADMSDSTAYVSDNKNIDILPTRYDHFLRVSFTFQLHNLTS